MTGTLADRLALRRVALAKAEDIADLPEAVIAPASKAAPGVLLDK